MDIYLGQHKWLERSNTVIALSVQSIVLPRIHEVVFFKSSQPGVNTKDNPILAH